MDSKSNSLHPLACTWLIKSESDVILSTRKLLRPSVPSIGRSSMFLHGMACVHAASLVAGASTVVAHITATTQLMNVQPASRLSMNIAS